MAFATTRTCARIPRSATTMPRTIWITMPPVWNWTHAMSAEGAAPTLMAMAPATNTTSKGAWTVPLATIRQMRRPATRRVCAGMNWMPAAFAAAMVSPQERALIARSPKRGTTAMENAWPMRTVMACATKTRFWVAPMPTPAITTLLLQRAMIPLAC